MMPNLHDLMTTLAMPGIFAIFCGMCGLILGGLTTVVGDRFGRIALAEDHGTDIPDDMGIVYPASRCEGCGRPLRTLERLPVIGWLVARGRCHACGFRVPVIYPLAEIGTGVLFAFVAFKFGPTATGLAVLCATWYFVALSVADIRHFVLPDRLTLSLLWLGLLAAAIGWIPVSPASAIMGACAGYVFLWIVREGYYLLRGVIGIGGGDLKLLAAIGAWIGVGHLFMTAALAAFIGLGLVLVFAALPKREGGYSPFGPALSLAGMVSLFWPGWVDAVTIFLMGLLT